MDFYETQTFDFKVVKGDTVNLKFEFYDKDGNPINDIAINNWQCKFTLRDPITDEPLLALQKTHDDTVVGGGGIYYNDDTQAPVGLNITQDNQIVVVLSYQETAQLEEGIYPYDIEFFIDQAYTSKFTAVKGNLIVTREHTPSV